MKRWLTFVSRSNRNQLEGGFLEDEKYDGRRQALERKVRTFSSSCRDCCRVVCPEPIEDRKRRLRGLLRLPHRGIALNETYREDGALIFKHACALGCEGIISKRLGTPYRAGRSAHF
jgi:hypothetical protein